MTKGEKHRARILHILEILWEQSDEQHPLTAAQILSCLEPLGICCERKTIYADLDELAEFGLDIIRTKKGAYIGKRQFELPELKLLVDVVQASQFITEKKSDELTEKLSHMLSEGERQQLKRQVFVKNRVKTMNESIYYNIDAINEGMNCNCKILFQYWSWNEKKEMQVKQAGNSYCISPWVLMWEHDKYYLIGYDDESKGMKHFRVDKMLHIEVTDCPRNGQHLYRNMDIASYSVESFGMFQGHRETVTLQVDNDVANVVIDRFGKDVWMHPVNEQKSSVVVDVMVSNQFFGWVTGLGGKIRIEGPQWVKEAYQNLLRNLMDNGME